MLRNQILENKFCVYQHIRPDTSEVFYVGIGTLKRPKQNWKRNKIWHDIVNKNNGNFEIKILFQNKSWLFCEQKEIELIKFHGRINLKTGILANLTDGGDGTSGVKQSQETIEKRVSKLRGIERSQSIRDKISKANTGKIRTPEMNEANRLRGKNRIHKKHTLQYIEEARKSKGEKLNYFIEVFKNDVSQGIFISAAEISRVFEIPNYLTKYFNGQFTHIRGFTFNKIFKNGTIRLSI